MISTKTRLDSGSIQGDEEFPTSGQTLDGCVQCDPRSVPMLDVGIEAARWNGCRSTFVIWRGIYCVVVDDETFMAGFRNDGWFWSPDDIDRVEF